VQNKAQMIFLSIAIVQAEGERTSWICKIVFPYALLPFALGKGKMRDTEH
jgi:hypothetical protein